MSLHLKTLAFGERFVGFDNYLQAFRDPQFLQGVGFVVKFSLVLIPLQMLVSRNVFASLLNVVTWQWAGYYMIIIYAALRGIDTSIYEAARMDGANSWQVALRIKVPMISSALVLILVFALIGTLQFFTEPQILRSVAAGSIDAAFTPNIYAYTLAFSYSQFNYASAISFALGVVVFAGSYAFLFLTRKKSGLL